MRKWNEKVSLKLGRFYLQIHKLGTLRIGEVPNLWIWKRSIVFTHASIISCDPADDPNEP